MDIKILVVEDEVPINELICDNLQKNGYRCRGVFDGMEAADELEKTRYDLVLLDIMLPKVDGYELLESIKPEKIPVIFLTAKSQIKDRVKGLRLGAEDYIVKPFAISELLARVEVVLRRFQKTESEIQFDEFTIDLENRTVKKYQTEISLTPKEFDLFVLFIRNINQTLFRDQIYMQVWEMEYTGDTRTIDYHVRCIRKKLELQERLKTVFMMGYRLESNEISSKNIDL